eukprot:COSAG01_NODE_1709_length_9424_cov_50.603968_8_plen_102_part_00
MPKRRQKSKPVVVPVESEDKKAFDKTPPLNHPLSMPRRSRIAICAPPGHGKTALVNLQEIAPLLRVRQQKVGLCAYDNKRYLHQDGVSSYSYGHYKIQAAD